MSKKIKDFRARQQVREEQINFLLSDIEKNLEEYKIAIEIKDKQLSDAKKILVSPKQSYDKTAAENKELKAYIENLKQHLQQQQVQFLEKSFKKYYQYKKTLPRKYKKVYISSETEFEEEEESKNNQIEKEAKIKKTHPKKKICKHYLRLYKKKNAKRDNR